MHHIRVDGARKHHLVSDACLGLFSVAPQGWRAPRVIIVICPFLLADFSLLNWPLASLLLLSAALPGATAAPPSRGVPSS